MTMLLTFGKLITMLRFWTCFDWQLKRVKSTSIVLTLVVFLTIMSWSFMNENISQRIDNYWSNASRNIQKWSTTRFFFNREGDGKNFSFDLAKEGGEDEFGFLFNELEEHENENTRNLSVLYNKTFADKVHLSCVFPKVNTFEESVMKVAGLDKKTIQCDNSYLPDLTYIHGNKLVINITKVDEHIGLDKFNSCRYRHILRSLTSDNWFRYSDWEKPFTNRTTLEANSEFLQVECINNTLKLVSKTYWPLIPRKKELDEMDSLNFKKRQIEIAPKETLNIIMICLDSLPRNQFIRALNKTYAYLMNNLTSFDLTMHAQLGINTFPNSLPLFSGRSIEEVSKWWNQTNYMDSFDLIWKTFEKYGYRTLFAEDAPYMGAFHYLKKGFKHPIVTYNNRPLSVAVDNDKDIISKDKMCAGNQLEMNFIFSYLDRFLDMFSEKPVFGVLMLSKITHDQTTNAKIIDDHVLNYYKSLEKRGHLNRTLLITFSDHGPRWGAIRDSVNGLFESKAPYTILTFPKWFLTKYPEIATNLKINTKRLTTHYDTYQTLQELLYFKSDVPRPQTTLTHGISLFDVIPWDRTCKDAFIPDDYCMCGFENITEINTKSPISAYLAKHVLKSLNSKINSSLCAVLTVNKILRIVKISLQENTTDIANDTTLFKVKLQTSPGNAIFEANVYAYNQTVVSIGNNIDRLNLYKGQSDCVQTANERLFCYCKNLLKEKGGEGTH